MTTADKLLPRLPRAQGTVASQGQASPSCILSDPTADDKAFQTLRARLALAGQALSRTPGDDGPVRFYVTRWNLVRELRDLDEVRRFAALVGVSE